MKYLWIKYDGELYLIEDPKFEAIIDGEPVILIYDRTRHNLVTLYRKKNKKS